MRDQLQSLSVKISGISLLAWVFYQAIFAFFAPRENVLWDGIFHISLFVAITCVLFAVVPYVSIKLVRWIFVFSMCYTLVLSVVLFFKMILNMNCYECYYQTDAFAVMLIKWSFPFAFTALWVTEEIKWTK